MGPHEIQKSSFNSVGCGLLIGKGLSDETCRLFLSSISMSSIDGSDGRWNLGD
jgi:hypothetical protein